MFADPTTATLGGSARTLNRISIKDTSSIYKSADEKFAMRVSHQNTKTRTRRLFRIEDFSGSYVNAITGASVKPGCFVYLVVDEPLTSLYTDDASETARTVDETLDFIRANTDAVVTKLLGAEI